nr:MAG TPA: hypothetical protein [Caudoviricetes sp.]
MQISSINTSFTTRCFYHTLYKPHDDVLKYHHKISVLTRLLFLPNFAPEQQ